MPGPLFYVPGGLQGGNRLELLVKVGLGFLAKESVSWTDIAAAGPDGGQGLVYTINSNDQELRIDSPTNIEGCDWQPAWIDEANGLPAGRYWLGRVRGKPVPPASLARSRQFPGENLTLADGNEWLIPIARRLPMNHGLDAQGRFSRVPKPEHCDYFEQAERMLAEVFTAVESDQDRVSIQDANSFAVKAIAKNYLVNRDVVAWLGLLDDECLGRITQIAIDLKNIIQYVREKKVPETAATLAT